MTRLALFVSRVSSLFFQASNDMPQIVPRIVSNAVHEQKVTSPVNRSSYKMMHFQ